MPSQSPPWPADPADLPRELADRRQVGQWLAPWFTGLSGDVSPRRGGRREAERLLARIDPLAYGQNRNHLAGAVTGLSPYIRHGVLSLAEVRDAVLARVSPEAESSERPPSQVGGGRQPGGAGGIGARAWHGAPRHPGEKLIQQLAWRDYWQRLWCWWGSGVHDDREPFKTGHPPGAYADVLPADLAAGQTGLACIDAFVSELVVSGWLHNHARLWLASYLVHWRRLRWQVGARWFHAHLLDADGASNSLSWQWVASTFSSKPYMFNRANLERFAGSSYCEACPAAGRGGAAAAGGCPFEASYEALQERLFPNLPTISGQGRERGRASAGGGRERPADLVDALDPPAAPPRRVPSGSALLEPVAAGRLREPVLWIHAEALGPANAALRAHPDRPAVFVFDPATEELEPWGLKRLVFLYECLLELPVTIRAGDPLDEVLAFMARCGADGVVTTRAVDPHLLAITARLAERVPVALLDPEPLVPAGPQPPGPTGKAAASRLRDADLRRFSRYWRWAEPRIWGAARRDGSDRGPAG